jgi:hypothetical protein
MAELDLRHPHAVADPCPHCGAPDATLTLLTSMTRYYACGRCKSSWQASRVRDAVQIAAPLGSGSVA